MSDYTLFAEAMDAFSKLAKYSLKTLFPYAEHSGNCSTSCPSCALKVAYWKIEGMTTQIPYPPEKIKNPKSVGKHYRRKNK